MSLSVRARLQLDNFNLSAAFEATTGITALFGPSGAGKTLTLRCIAGLTRPGEGRIVVSERVVLDTAAGIDLPPRERDIGYVFQQYALFPHLNVAQNVAFGISRLSRGDRYRRTAELLTLVGLEGFDSRRITQLSGGQQQRVALARALATEPQLLLLDEPFAAVDLRVRRRLRAELRRIHEITDTPMLFVTHDLSEVRQLADSLILLEDGQVVDAGPTGRVLNEPRDAQAAELLEALGSMLT